MEVKTISGDFALQLEPVVRRDVAPILLLGALLAVAWFAGLGMRGLFMPDEGRYAEIPREMLVSGDWLTPRLNGLKYFEKPPLQYWATAAAYAAFGESDWTARLWPALTGFAGILVLALAASRMWSFRIGVLAGVVLGTSAGYFLAGQFVTLDMGLTFLLTCALLSFLVAQREEAEDRQRRSWMMLAWAALGVGVLSKGLVALALPAMAVAGYVLSTRRAVVLMRLHMFTGGLLMLLIAAPWFVLVQEKNPEFFQFFFIREHFQRFATEAHQRPGPWWYFLPVGLLGMMPWTPAVVSALTGIKSLFRSPRGTNFDAERFLLIWVLVIFVFFSISKSKLPGYVLPAFPALALLAAIQLERLPRQLLMHSARTLVIVGALWLVGLPVLGTLKSAAPFMEHAGDAARYLYFAGMAMVGCGVVAYLLQKRGALWPAVGVLATAMLLACHLCAAFFAQVDDHYSSRSLVRKIPVEGGPFDPSIPVFSVETFDHSLPFYLRRTMTLVDYKSELAEGIAAEPDRYVNSMDQFVAIWTKLPAGFAMMTPSLYRGLSDLGLPMRELARDERRVLVSRR
jgi:4-amino-4-deoxy-L-arabinose transferase-like glycosyltransferase